MIMVVNKELVGFAALAKFGRPGRALASSRGISKDQDGKTKDDTPNLIPLRGSSNPVYDDRPFISTGVIDHSSLMIIKLLLRLLLI